MIITGLRGGGKTVLLNEFRKRAAFNGWPESFGLHARIDPDGHLTVGFGSTPAEGSADAGELSVDLRDLLVAVGEAAQEAGRGVVLLIDEIQFLSKPQLEAAVMSIHKTVQRELPITLVGAGLPQIAELAGEAKSYAERLFKFPPIDVLSAADATAALTQPARDEGVSFDEDAIERVLEVTGRYPYFWRLPRSGRRLIASRSSSGSGGICS